VKALPTIGFDTDAAALPISRRHAVIGLGFLVSGFLLAACAGQSQPAPGSWAEDYARRKQKYREWGQGTGKK
jgi:hypothetical protein